MNIFYVDADPNIAAQSLGNSHVVKMILETAQLLSTAHWVLDPTNPKNAELYKPTHKMHPSAIWARTSAANYRWLYWHLRGLLNEYTFRYGKIHKTTRLAALLYNNPKGISNEMFTEPPQCMPDEYKVPNDAVKAYRNYYCQGKSHLHKWKNRRPQEWLDSAQKLVYNGDTIGKQYDKTRTRRPT